MYMKFNRKLMPLVIAFLVLVINSCSTIKRTESENGTYTCEIKKTNLFHDPVIYGSLSETGDSVYRIPSGAVKVDLKDIYRTDNEGNFSFHIKPGKHRFRGLQINYRQVETKPINTSKGDSIKLTFKLNVNNIPLN